MASETRRIGQYYRASRRLVETARGLFPDSSNVSVMVRSGLGVNMIEAEKIDIIDNLSVIGNYESYECILSENIIKTYQRTYQLIYCRCHVTSHR